MNSVSWFLYIADVLGNMRGVLFLAAISCVVFCAGCAIGQAVSEGDLSKSCPGMWWYWWRCAIGAFVLGLLATFIPSKNTMYAIAASEVGERVVMNEQVRGIADDATKALHQWIKKQIEPSK